MPASPGAVLPRDMNARQWAEFVTQSGIQGDRTIKSFTPTWLGFGVDPVGDLAYMDFGAIVMIWNPQSTALLGTSNANFMQITNLPEAIQPRDNANRKGQTLVVDNGTSIYDGFFTITSNSLVFGLADTAIVATRVTYTTTGFTAASTKGIAGGALIIYSK